MSKSIAAKILYENLKGIHESMDKTMDGVTDTVAHFHPPHKANPIAGTYAHFIFSEDFFVQGILQQKKPLFETDWKDKTGISELQPTEWQTAYPEWLKKVTIDVEKVKAYKTAVYKASETYIKALTDEDLEKEIDMSMFGMPAKMQGEFIGGLIITHAGSIMGEIAVLKGIQNLKGYPF